ncbi:hypothetical protein [Phycisphaera mikurensis]|uniref:Peptidase M50 family protein n=1 Tax=Phycisphaera mikurensis (strain NBRC 102666 / KCTC 22515 / FYK2301M01) TaxID=1142394 RepID=I0ICD6_PHYMF|nr:hypothetical protein [Phycisphaera mikurensis]MBB6442198.1 putative peptide zinc metalloprotease protein [Phycisphaera mikurensis]BAM02924.1 hypothetical protein PSMK_07650 [Phycisphaera mikurensis NBRC 102666]
MTGAHAEPWEAVGALKLRLRDGLRWSHHATPGGVWRVVRNPLSGRCARVDRAGFVFLHALDGERTAEEALAIAAETLGPAAPDREEALGLIAFATSAGLLGQSLPPAAAAVVERRSARRRAARVQRGLSVLFWRQRLWNPDRLLDRVAPPLSPVFSGLGFAVWLLALLAGAWHLAAGSERFAEALAGALRFDPAYLLGALGVFVGLKLLHELAHGVACKHFGRGVPGGCEVPAVGLMLLVAVPVPFIDVTSSWLIPSRWGRAAVAAAGLYAELFVAALAAVVWAHTAPGLLNTLAFQTVLIASIATILFNANPLLRYDGYHALADAAGIANLGQRAQAMVTGAALRLLGVPAERAFAAAPGGESLGEASTRQRVLLVVYAVASTAYRWLILAVIVVMVGGQWLLLGKVLAAMAAVGWLVLPLARFVARLRRELAEAGRGRRALAVGGGVAAAAVALAVLVPVPRFAFAPGVAEARATAQVRPRTGGFLRRVLPAGEAADPAGPPLLTLADPALAAERAGAAAQLAAARVRLDAAAGGPPAEAAALADRCAALADRLAELDRRIAALRVPAAAAGVWIPEDPHLAAGDFLAPGVPAGVVADLSGRRARLLADQHLGPRLAAAMGPGGRVTVRSSAGRFEARVLEIAPAGSTRLPSAALGQAGGGAVRLETGPRPDAAPGGEAAEPFFEVVLDLVAPADGRPLPLPGERLRGTFRLPAEPPAVTAVRWIRQALLVR